MNQEQIKQIENKFDNEYSKYKPLHVAYFEGYEDGAKAEREICAKVLDDMADEAEREREPSGYVNYYREKAAAIRARSQMINGLTE